jgi:hypothetical protein
MIDLRLGDCRDLLPTVADASIDCVIADPPYPEVRRPYGRLTEAEWWALMMDVCRETRRVLKPTGSAVFVLQPNSRKVGSMRGWLWRFMAWACDEWNMVQDVWWWNNAVLPSGVSIRGRLTRPSVKACVWLGPANCYRDQDAVLLPLGDWVDRKGSCYQSRRQKTAMPSGQGVARGRVADTARRRGGSTPFNLIVATRGVTENVAVAKHPASTPLKVADWWVRFISPEGGIVCDPFMGSGTVGIAALKRGRSFVGFESMPEYFAVAQQRIEHEATRHPLFGANA